MVIKSINPIDVYRRLQAQYCNDTELLAAGEHLNGDPGGCRSEPTAVVP